MKKLGIFTFLFMLVFTACRKDINNVDITQTTPDPTINDYIPPQDIIESSVIGFVVDENDAPVANADVFLGSEVTQTDDYGHFFFQNEDMNALGTLVRVEMDGFFNGSRRFFPNENQESRVKIKLLSKSFDQSFNANNGGTINFGNGASVEFAPGSIRDAAGNDYAGTVNVATKWLDPSATETLNEMPGNLQGVNQLLEEVALGTYGMIAVELEGTNGEALNIKDGETATISMPVPQSLQNGAPAEIPLWSYHEEYGIWVEESKATLQGGQYVGEVSHFSFWNCDYPYDLIQLDMTLVDNDGNPLNNYLVKLTITSSSPNGGIFTSGCGYSDQNGVVSGKVPANEVLTMEILDPCGGVIYSEEIGPFSVDTDLGNITIDASAVNNTTISGNLLDCNGDPITNGLVIASFQGSAVYHYTSTSNFTMTFSTCSSTGDVDIIGINMDDLTQSDIQTAPSNETTDLGDISVCGGSIDSYVLMTIEGGGSVVTVIFENATASVVQGTTYIQGGTPNSLDNIGFGFGGVTAGDYSSNNWVEVVETALYGQLFGQGLDNFNVTQYDSNTIVGTFSGQLFNNNGNTYTVTGQFNVVL